MKSTPILLRIVALSLLAVGTLAQAATLTGTVTNKTTNKPSAGDAVALVDTQAGMGEVAHTTTDAHGKYSLSEPGTSSYLVRITHQGATYFIAAPQAGASGDLAVYDAAAQVDGVSISADVIECETENGVLFVNERYFVHNGSSPARTLNSAQGFEVVLPAEAVLVSAAATRPGGLATNVQLKPGGQKGHYFFTLPIQPSQGEKDTLFDVRYHVPYSGGKYSFKTIEPMPTDNLAVLLPKSMSFAGGAGATFKQFEEDPGILTFIAKNVLPGKTAEFTVSGNGSLPRDSQSSTSTTQSSDASSTGNQAGGGIGTPINTPDPLSKYKWWILGVLVLVLAAVAAFLLRKPVTDSAAKEGAELPPASIAAAAPADRSAFLLSVLKEELFALESEKLSGTLSATEYEEVKSALEVVLKRALKRSAS